MCIYAAYIECVYALYVYLGALTYMGQLLYRNQECLLHSIYNRVCGLQTWLLCVTVFTCKLLCVEPLMRPHAFIRYVSLCTSTAVTWDYLWLQTSAIYAVSSMPPIFPWLSVYWILVKEAEVWAVSVPMLTGQSMHVTQLASWQTKPSR